MAKRLIDEATVRLVLEALENSIDLVSQEARNAEELYGKYPTRLARIQGLVAFEVAHEKAIAALKALAEQPAQEKDWGAVGEAHIAALKKSSKAMVEDAAVRAVHKVMAEFEAKSDERLMEQPAKREPVTEAQIVAGARVLNQRMADMCSIDAEDQWKQYGEDFKADARAVLEAAHGIKENA